MVKVGIIDSGINADAIRNNVIYRNCMDRQDYADVNGHGTMCAYIIEKYSRREIDFYSYKIFDKELMATKKNIIRALENAIDDKLDILNLSLSINNSDDGGEFTDLFHKLKINGTKIIASKSKTGKNTLLDYIEDVVIVDGCDTLNEDYRKISYNRILCSREAFLCKWYKNNYAFFGGNSKATALYTALVLKDDKYVKKRDRKIKCTIADINEMCTHLASESYVEFDSLLKSRNWEEFGNYFELELIKNLILLLGYEYIDNETIYYKNVNNYSALKDLLT